MSEPQGAGARLHRLLAVLAYLARVGEASIDDLATRFGVPAEVLVAELELAACCGLPPYTPDQLLELVVDDERVTCFGLEALRRPPRLTAEEGLAVAAAARALLGVPGADAGPLASALAKLESALGEDRLRVEVDLSAHMAVLRRAVERRELVEIDYLGAWRGAETARRVEPHDLSLREGRAYLDAWCHLAGGWRRFALERISAARPVGQHFAARSVPEELGGPGAFSGGGSRRVRISVPEALAGAIERLAVAPAERRGDRLVVSLAVADERWLGLVLLRLGPEAEVLEPAELGDARRSAARRALRRYRRPVAETPPPVGRPGDEWTLAGPEGRPPSPGAGATPAGRQAAAESAGRQAAAVPEPQRAARSPRRPPERPGHPEGAPGVVPGVGDGSERKPSDR